MAEYYALKKSIDTNYPAGQFVAIAGGKIVADDAALDKLIEKLAALGIDRMEALVDRAGSPIPRDRSILGNAAAALAGRMTWNFAPRTEV
jgi:hypothetical protein